MKNILKLSLITLAAIAMVACEDTRETNMVSDGVLLSTANYQKNLASVSVYDGQFSFNVFKSGKGTQSGSVKIEISEALVEWYNEKNDTDYAILPEDCYSISTEGVSFHEDAVSKQVMIFWDAKKVSAAIEELGKEAVVPIKLIDSNLEIWEGTDYLLVNPAVPSIRMNAENASRKASLNTTYKDVQSFSVAINTAIERDAIVTFIMDPTLVPAYNEANGTSYVPALNRMIELPMKATIAANTSSANVDYTILSEQFYNTFKGEENSSPRAVLAPIRILSATIDDIPVPFSAEPFYVLVEPATIPSLGFTTTRRDWPAFVGVNGTDYVDAQLSLSEALTGLDSDIALSVDYSLVDAWNAANGKNYVAPIEGLVSVPEKVFVPGNVADVTLNVTINRSRFEDMGDFTGVVVPIVPTSLIVNGVGNSIEADPFYIVLTKPTRGTIQGPWPVLYGENNQSIGNGDTVDGKDGSWYTEHYTVAGLCDGKTAVGESYPWGAVWGAWFDTPMQLPLEFVFDMGIPHQPDKIFKYEFSSFQGSWNHIQIYLSDTYGADGADAEWKLAYDGNIGASGWESSTGECHNADMTGDVIGRYLKIVLVEPTGIYYNNSSSHMAGYIREIWFEGL